MLYKLGHAQTLQQWENNHHEFAKGPLLAFIVHCYQYIEFRDSISSSRTWSRALVQSSDTGIQRPSSFCKRLAQIGSSAPFICVVDSKSLYETVQKCVNPASQCEDKRTSIDIALIKEELSQLGGTIRWVDGRTMLADSLTKEMRSDLLRHVIETGRWSILEEGASLQRKLLERKPSHEVMFAL